jgi:hypothetical protein
MRYISIVAGGPTNKGANQHFIDSVTKMRVRCTFALNEDCSPDCAACDITNLGREASCNRLNGEDNLIGLLPGEKIAPNSVKEKE